MSEVFKTFAKEDIQKHTFIANKQYTLGLDGYSASWNLTNPIELQGELIVPKIVGLVAKSDRFTEFNSGSEDLNSALAIPSRSVWDNLWHMYYRDWPDPGKVFCTRGHYKEERELYNTAYVLSVPYYMHGNQIFPKSIQLDFKDPTGNVNITLLDDGHGNLYNAAHATTSGDSISSSIPPKHGEAINLPFKDLTPYQYMPTSGYGYLHEQKSSGSIRDYGLYGTTVSSNNVKVITGSVFGTGIEFTGQYGESTTIPTTYEAAKTKESWSYVKIQSDTGNPHLDFIENEDFAVSMHVKIPAAAQHDVDKTSNVILSHQLNSTSGSFHSGVGGDLAQQYPFRIIYHNSTKKIRCHRHDGNGNRTVLTTLSSLNDGKFHHILYQKSGSKHELFVDSIIEASATHSDAGQVRAAGPIYVGAASYRIPGDLDPVTNTRGTREVFTRAFNGSINNLKIYSGSLSRDQVNYMSASSGTGQNHWGNVFYEHGQIVVTHPSSAYCYKAASSSSVTFRNDTTITENLYSCNIKANEYNQTLNPSIIADHKTKEFHGFTSKLEWNPYITRIGLYNDEGQLLVIGSLAQPIQKMPEYDMTFVVRFDT